jgi:drug/metabolite transporter (DMT)-like permease
MTTATRSTSYVAAILNRPFKLTGFICLGITALGWGLNWPATKLLLLELPPLTARGIAGILSSLALAAVAVSRGEALIVPREARFRLLGFALLNVSAWMGLTTVSMIWLKAGEAATLAYTMPIWATLLAKPILGEKLDWRRMLALVLGVSGIALLLGGNGVSADAYKLPGIVVALSAAMLFALGTVLYKRAPLPVPPMAMTAWQIGIGCLVLLIASFALEEPHLLGMDWFGWAALTYTSVVSLGICYIAWFAAVRQLQAGTAAIGTLLTPVVGVAASTIWLGEPLMLPQLGSIMLVATSILLTART